MALYLSLKRPKVDGCIMFINHKERFVSPMMCIRSKFFGLITLQQ